MPRRPLGRSPLPRTAAQRRRENLRATCLALLPFLLFALAAAPRVWAPDLAPFGPTQAAELTEARRLATALAEGRWWALAIADVPALLTALLVGLADPVRALVVLLGLLDGAAAVLVFLAARTLLGTGPAVLAASLYAVSPWAWALARDPTVGGLAALASGALLAAIACVRCPRTRWVLVLAVLGGLLPRVDPTAWIFALPLAATLLIARPGRRAALVGVGAFGVIAAPAILGAADRVRPGAADPFAAFHLAWWLVAGVGAEHRLVGAVTPAAPPQSVSWLALGCVAILVLLGTLATPALGRSARAAVRLLLRRSVVPLLGRSSRPAVLPLLWVALPLAALTLPGAASASPEVLVGLLPAATVLMALPLGRRDRLAARLVRRAGLGVGVVAVALGTAMLGGLLWQAEALAGAGDALPYPEWAAAAETRPGPLAPVRAPELATGSATILPLRFWHAVAEAAIDAAERVGAEELLVVPSGGPIGDGTAELAAALGDRLAVRPLPVGAVTLPLAREGLYLLLPGGEVPGELSWPSSRLASVSVPGADARADLVSLRARPAEHWLARATETPIRFADGSALVGVALRSGGSGGGPWLDLYWTFQAEPSATPSARVAELIGRRGSDELSVGRVLLPGPEERRGGELVLRRTALALPPGGADGVVGLSLALMADDGAPVPARVAGRALAGAVPLVSVTVAEPAR